LRALKAKTEEKPDLNKIRELAKEVIDQYKALSEEAKTNLQETFPKVSGVLKSQSFN
jgi:gas vesicle protein